jgi:hypothetical protein
VTNAVVRREIRVDLLRVDLGRAGCTVDKKGFRQKKPSGVILEGRRIHRLVALLRATSALAIHLARERQVGMGVGPTRNVRKKDYEIRRGCQEGRGKFFAVMFLASITVTITGDRLLSQWRFHLKI